MSEHDGAARWLTIHDELLRGLTHALSNRVGTVAAVSSLLELSDGASSTRALDMLRAETDRLERLLLQLRQLPYRAGIAAEPILAADVVNAAIALVAHHPAARDVRCEVVAQSDLQPAWSDPGALQLAIAVALISAQVNAPTGTEALDVRLGSATDTVRIEVCAHADDTKIATAVDADDAAHDERLRDASAARWLLRATNGSATVCNGGLAIEVMTLGAARRAR